MCGIVGLHLRTPDLYPQLGSLAGAMLSEMEDRGPDSAGIALYGDPKWSPPGKVTVSVLEGALPPEELVVALEKSTTDVTHHVVGSTVLVSAKATAADLVSAVRTADPAAIIAGFGEDVAVIKGVGRPSEMVTEIGLKDVQGWQAVGHTRMATESAVVAAGAHPYAVGPGQCMVHNGSFSNHATIRRELRRAGVEFDSENDTEVGARFIAQALAQGKSVEVALKELCDTFDGFYTLLVSDRDSFAVVRDAISCKPAVIAETDDWVAMASEYRALVGLPGIETAQVYEPSPERVYVWTR